MYEQMILYIYIYWHFISLYLGYVRNNWCRTNPKLVLHTHTHHCQYHKTCAPSTTILYGSFFFYRSRQAHKLSKFNWIPFILMFHYQTISIRNDVVRIKKKTLRELFSFSTHSHALPSKRIKHSIWERWRVAFYVVNKRANSFSLCSRYRKKSISIRAIDKGNKYELMKITWTKRQSFEKWFSLRIMNSSINI